MVDTQCFAYDYARRLSSAWTATDNCVNSPTPGNIATVGGPAPYWQSWTYDPAGDRATQTDHDTGGNTANDTTTTYTYPAAGSATDQPHTLTSTTATGPNATVNTASYTYDPSGNTTAITGGSTGNQSLTWNDQNQLATDTTSTGSTSYIYDTNGNLVIRRDPGQTTLFVDDEQVILNTTTNTTTATRYYTLGGVTIGARTPTIDSGNVQILVPDRQGTDQLTIDTATYAVTRRQYLPFGNPRGTTPATWPGGDKGYVGGTPDPTTTLENLGAREYNPANGRFLSADPILEVTDPTQMGGYDYAGNNPVTGSDPTGLEAGSWCVTQACAEAGANSTGLTGYGVQLGGFAGGGTSPPTYIRVSPRVAVQGTSNAERLRKLYIQEIHTFAPAVTNPDEAPPTVEGMAWADICAADHHVCDSELQDMMFFFKPSMDSLLINSCAVESGCGTGASGIVSNPGDSPYSFGGRSSAPPRTINIVTPTACNSFNGSTPVLMSDGTSKSIDQVKVGDTVADAVPGAFLGLPDQHHTVTAVHVTYTDHDYTDVTVNTARGPATITGTAHHLYWDATTHSWTEADQLHLGDQLQTSNDVTVSIIALRNYTATMVTYNLTIGTLHTYYVVAGDTPILVHNTQCRTADGKFANSDGTPGRVGAVDERTTLDQLDIDGASVVRGSVTVTIPGVGKRIYDGAVQIDGTWYGIETKGGTSPLTPRQQAADAWLNTPGNTATSTGRNSGYPLEGTFDSWVPEPGE